MAPVASQLIEEVTAHAQSDSLEDAREICADGTYFPNNLRTNIVVGNYTEYTNIYCMSNMKVELMFVVLHGRET